VLVERDVPHTIPPARERFVDGDPRQPGGKARTAGELAEMRVCAHPGVLHDVFRLCVVPEHGADRPEDTSVVSSHENLERPLIAGEHTGDHDVVVGRRVRVGLRDSPEWQHVGPPPLPMEFRGGKRFPGTI
jgi:hypothetical protein